MKKTVFLSFLLIPAATHCMEVLKYSDIEKEVSKLDELLYENQHWLYRKGCNDPLSILVACKYPDRCYSCPEYQLGTLREHNSETFAALDSLKNARYKGFSAIGAVTLSTTVHYDEQKQIIQKLLKAGYVPTDKDQILVLHLEQKANHSRPDGTSDALDQTEERIDNSYNFFSSIINLYVWLTSFCHINEKSSHLD